MKNVTACFGCACFAWVLGLELKLFTVYILVLLAGWLDD